MTVLEELLAEATRIRAERDRAQAALDKADQAVLEERFSGWDRYPPGDVILVPRTLFGQVRMWPAQIASIVLHYESGRSATGEDWVRQAISYGVRLQQKDGTFGGSITGFWHEQVAPYTREQETGST